MLTELLLVHCPCSPFSQPRVDCRSCELFSFVERNRMKSATRLVQLFNLAARMKAQIINVGREGRGGGSIRVGVFVVSCDFEAIFYIYLNIFTSHSIITLSLSVNVKLLICSSFYTHAISLVCIWHSFYERSCRYFSGCLPILGQFFLDRYHICVAFTRLKASFNSNTHQKSAALACCVLCSINFAC